MASPDHSKSISTHSIPFPKTSTDAFNDMTAFSPPADSWIIRYPKKENSKRVPEAEALEDPCRKYMESSEIPVKSNKSLGTDDHFKSAVCSKNLLNVCEKLMTKKEFVAHSNESADDDFEELSLMNEKSRMEFYRTKHGNRRGSQSLPASPKMERKNLADSTVAPHNPYFTITKPEPKKESSISFLTGLFGITAAPPDLARANLAQKFEHDKGEKFANAAETFDVSEQRSRKTTPKPQEYREMNMFSPTSM